MQSNTQIFSLFPSTNRPNSFNNCTEGAFKSSEIEAGMTTYFISSKENPQDFELEHRDDPTNKGMSLFLKKIAILEIHLLLATML